jgi:hypothetical protein
LKTDISGIIEIDPLSQYQVTKAEAVRIPQFEVTNYGVFPIKKDNKGGVPHVLDSYQ